MFVSNLNQKMAQRFLVLVLLPHVRADIRSNRRLHFALFQVGGGGLGGRVGAGALSWRLGSWAAVAANALSALSQAAP